MVQNNGNYYKINVIASAITLLVAFLYFGFFTYSKPENTTVKDTVNNIEVVKRVPPPNSPPADQTEPINKPEVPIVGAKEDAKEDVTIKNPTEAVVDSESENQELPEDIKRAIATPPKIVTLEEVNTPRDLGQ